MFAGSAGGIGAEVVCAFPVIVRTNGPRRETPATVRADILQNIFHALSAESALERADHGFGRVRWKRCIAVLARRSQFEHRLV